MTEIKEIAATVVFAFASLATAQTGHNHPPPQRSIVGVAMHSLIDRSIYACYLYPSISPMASANPAFYDGTDSAGKQIPDAAVANYFHTGDRLVIRSAESDMATITERFQSESHPTVFVGVAVENQTNKVTAWVDVEVYKAQVTPTRLLAGITDNISFSRTPVKSDVHIGMTKNEVECALSIPDHTNTDELGGDQMVYWDGKMYVYISPRTGRVRDVQTSF